MGSAIELFRHSVGRRAAHIHPPAHLFGQHDGEAVGPAFDLEGKAYAHAGGNPRLEWDD